jgi:GT2 family glycosyltransferase
MTLQGDAAHGSDSPNVAIVVIHFENLEQTLMCLGSLAEINYPNYRIIVVDNSPEARQGQLLLQQFPQITLLEMERNLGFSGGCNAGIAHALDNGFEYVWLINNDARSKADSLCELIHAAKKLPDAGVLGGALLEQKKDGIERTGMGYIDYWRAKTFTREASSMDVKACDWVCGGNMLLSAAALAHCGAFDDAYFLYKEDVELCVRLTRSGYECVYVPGAEVFHEGSGSTSGQRSIWRYYYGARNRMLFFSRYASRPQFIVGVAGFSLQLVRHLILYPVSSGKKKIKTRGEYLGFYDFCRGKFGQRRFG